MTSGGPAPASSNTVGNAPKLVLPDGTEFVLGMSQSIPVQTTKKDSGPSVTLDALQKSDKWLPSLPMLDTRAWKSRTDEILGFESWVESFVAWVGLVSEPFATEIRYAVSAPTPIVQADLSQEQESRGSRLLSMLIDAQASFQGCFESQDHFARVFGGNPASFEEWIRGTSLSSQRIYDSKSPRDPSFQIQFVAADC